MSGISRRALGRVAAGVALAPVTLAACTRRPAETPPPGPGVGFVLSNEQLTTAALVDQAAAAERAGFK
ncbi:MAG: F420-dependent hydroxymycolic acid dehydrogenase, partial [Mycobacterium sp.]